MSVCHIIPCLIVSSSTIKKIHSKKLMKLCKIVQCIIAQIQTNICEYSRKSKFKNIGWGWLAKKNMAHRQCLERPCLEWQCLERPCLEPDSA
jgi:hypothetical protein